jgi:hypothetical protein
MFHGHIQQTAFEKKKKQGEKKLVPLRFLSLYVLPLKAAHAEVSFLVLSAFILIIVVA